MYTINQKKKITKYKKLEDLFEILKKKRVSFQYSLSRLWGKL